MFSSVGKVILRRVMGKIAGSGIRSRKLDDKKPHASRLYSRPTLTGVPRS